MVLQVYQWPDIATGTWLRRAEFPNKYGKPGWALAAACCCGGPGCGCPYVPSTMWLYLTVDNECGPYVVQMTEGEGIPGCTRIWYGELTMHGFYYDPPNPTLPCVDVKTYWMVCVSDSDEVGQCSITWSCDPQFGEGTESTVTLGLDNCDDPAFTAGPIDSPYYCVGCNPSADCLPTVQTALFTAIAP